MVLKKQRVIDKLRLRLSFKVLLGNNFNGVEY